MLAQGAPAQASVLTALTQIAAALDAAHEVELAHGWVRPEAVLIDEAGRAWLSDFGLTAGAATVSSDRAAFATLVRTCLGKRAVPRGKWETASALVAAATARLHARADRDEGGPWRRRMRRWMAPRR